MKMLGETLKTLNGTVSTTKVDWDNDLEDILRIFRAGCINSDSQYKFTAIRALKILFVLILATFLSPYRPIDSKSLTFVFGSLHKKILGDSDEYVHHATAISKLSDFWDCRTLTSLVERKYRLAILRRAIHIHKQRQIKQNIVRWLEFILFYETVYRYLLLNREGSITLASTTDRYVSWISGLCRKYRGYLYVYQHGTLLHFSGLPHKIHVDKYYVYNDAEKAAVSSKIVSNESCTYKLFPFVSHVDFAILNKEAGIHYFGVISQGDYHFNEDCIQSISETVENCRIILMLHPHERINKIYRKMLSVYSKLRIEEIVKYSNLDYVVMRNSTMIYDYHSQGYKPICCVISPNNLYGFLSSEIQYFDSLPDFRDALMTKYN